jgi:hypothetical protein
MSKKKKIDAIDAVEALEEILMEELENIGATTSQMSIKNKKLNKVGLYERDWVGHEAVVKKIENDYTILIKNNGEEWSWYNDKYITEEQKNVINELYDVNEPKLDVIIDQNKDE